MDLDRLAWPRGGRVGRATRGSAQGCYLLLWTEELPEWWTFYLVPAAADGSIDGYIDGDAAMAGFVQDWGVEWLAPEEAERVAREHFPVREDLLREPKRRRWRREAPIALTVAVRR